MPSQLCDNVRYECKSNTPSTHFHNDKDGDLMYKELAVETLFSLFTLTIYFKDLYD